MAEVYRPDVLSFRPVLKSELFAQPASTSRFSAKTQPSQRQKHKKVSAHGRMGSTLDAF